MPLVVDFGARLEVVSRAVSDGNGDLRALGFWKLVGEAKRNPALISKYAVEIGRIDQEAFDRAVGLRFPVGLGNLALLAGIVAAFALIWLSAFIGGFAAGVCFVAAAVVLCVAVHCPAHWAVGKLAGIDFTCYFLGGPFPPRPGLKTDYASYLRANPDARAWMHASGAIATKLAPLIVLEFFRRTHAPPWAGFAVLAIFWIQILTDIFLSTKSSDWKKVRREFRVANYLKEKK